MSTGSSTDGRARSSLLAAVESAYWVAAVTAGVVAPGLVVVVATGSGLVGLKYYLFVVGVLLFGVGSFAIQPASPRLGDDAGFRRPVARAFSLSLDGDEPFRFEELLGRLPPLRDGAPSLDHRVSRDTKLFLASLAVLGVSLALETVFGVTA